MKTQTSILETEAEFPSLGMGQSKNIFPYVWEIFRFVISDRVENIQDRTAYELAP